MNRKIGQASILLGSIFFSIIVGFISVSIEAFYDNQTRRSQFMDAVEGKYASTEYQFFRQLEFCLREGELPYYGGLVAKRIQERLGVSAIKIFDGTLRLVFSNLPTKEIFQSELRHDSEPLLPSQNRKLSTGEYAYRSSDGKFFLVYSKPYLPIALQTNPNIEYGFNYWVYDDEIGNIYFTNDYSLLNGDRESSELLKLFQDNEGKKISWRMGGEDRILEKIRFKGYSVYLIDSFSLIPKWAWSRSLLVSILSFSFICFLLICYSAWNGKFKRLSKSKVYGIGSFLTLIIFYQGVISYTPDFRFHKPWAKHRFEQMEVLLKRLEKNIIDQVSNFGADETIRSIHSDPIIKEIYLWKTGGSTSQLSNRFGLEMNFYLDTATKYKTSRMIESHFEYLFIIPVGENNSVTSFAIVLLDPLLMAAKKEKDRDEFYFPDNALSLAEDKSRELFFLHPRAWDQSVIYELKHFNQSISHFSLIGTPFESYYYPSHFTNPSIANGLFVFKSEGVFSILGYATFLTFIPFLLLSFLASFRKFRFTRKEELVSKPMSEISAVPLEQKEEVKEEPIFETVETLAPNLAPITEPQVESAYQEIENIPQEAIAEEPILIQMGGETVKNRIHKYLPPSLWNKSTSEIPVEIQRKRDSIFNLELKSLVSQVTTVEPRFDRRSTDVRKDAPIWPILEEKRFEYSLLDRIYRGDGVSLNGIVEYTRNFIARVGSPSFAFLFLNDTIGSYHSQISYGLDYNTRSNLIFLYDDPFLTFDASGFFSVKVNDSIKQDKFISKKFSWEILAQLGTILAFNLDHLGFHGIFLMLTNKNETESFLEPHKRMVTEKLRQLIPALHTLTEKEDKTPDLFEDSLSWMVRSFLQATLGGRRTAHITHVKWVNFHPTDENETKKASLLTEVAEIVKSKDRVIENSPNTFLIISEGNLKAVLENLLKSYPFPYEVKYMIYPDDGENYYLYL